MERSIEIQTIFNLNIASNTNNNVLLYLVPISIAISIASDTHSNIDSNKYSN